MIISLKPDSAWTKNNVYFYTQNWSSSQRFASERFGSECEHFCLFRFIILELNSPVFECFPKSALQISQWRDLGFYVSFLTVFYITSQFPLDRIYWVMRCYSPQKGSFLNQYSYLKLCMHSFMKFRTAALSQYTSSHCLLCFPCPREKFPSWEDRLFPPLPFPKGCSFNSWQILSWIPKIMLLQLHRDNQLNTPLWLAWKIKSLSLVVS